MNITRYPVINRKLGELVAMSKASASERARYRERNPRRLVSPVRFMDGAAYTIVGNDNACSWWRTNALQDKNPMAVHILDLHNIRAIWFS